MAQYAFKPVLIDLLRQAQISQNTFIQELPLAERAAIGTPEFWAAKDHVAHMTFWRQRLVLTLQALLRKAPQPQSEDFEELNPIIFEEQRYRSWSDIIAESDQVYADLIALADQLSEEDLTAFNRFDWIHEGMPLYTSFMGNCYEHTQNHLAQYSLDRDDLERALDTYEAWAKRALEAGIPETLQGYVFYNLACFYATHSRLEKASMPLQQAFTLYPHSRELALTDPDLVELRPNQPE
jgi:tetratricopeptide (TPR) repeat protein